MHWLCRSTRQRGPWMLFALYSMCLAKGTVTPRSCEVGSVMSSCHRLKLSPTLQGGCESQPPGRGCGNTASRETTADIRSPRSSGATEDRVCEEGGAQATFLIMIRQFALSLGLAFSHKGQRSRHLTTRPRQLHVRILPYVARDKAALRGIHARAWKGQSKTTTQSFRAP